MVLIFTWALSVVATVAADHVYGCYPGADIVKAMSFIAPNSQPPPGTKTPVRGTVKLTQPRYGGLTCIEINISGLGPNTTHGFHVHEYGDTLTEGCQSTGGHYNPFNLCHGAPQDQFRHVGDLGNLVADASGTIKAKFSDHLISVVGPLSVLGRAFVIHQRPDDLGRGVGSARRESLITGNAGARLGCGVIFLAPTMSRDLK